MSPLCAVKTWPTKKGGRISPHTQAGGALVVVLILICVLSIIGANLLLTTSTRYHTTFQSASWQEAIVGAEAGVDLTMNELRKRVVVGPSAAFKTNWTTVAPAGAAYPNYGHAFPSGNQPYLLVTHAGEGSTTMQTRIYLDVPGSSTIPLTNFAVAPPAAASSFISEVDNPALRDPDGVDRTRWLFRIRALGIAGLAGPPLANIDNRDNELRRFSFFNDWRTGQSVPTPQVARLVEVLVQPQTNFRNALMANSEINLEDQSVLIDSYDSSKGPYNNPGNFGQMGNVATNGQIINAANASVDGNAMTNNGAVNAGANVTGQQSSTFYQDLTPLTQAMLNPAWASVPNGGLISGSATFTASTDSANPTVVRLAGINLPAGGYTISLAAPASKLATPPPSYIKVYVQGDITTAGTSAIELDASVNAIIYFTGNINLVGDGIVNDSILASQLVLNGIQPPVNSNGTYPSLTVNIDTDQDFEGVVYAPSHDLSLNMVAAVAAGGPASKPGPAGPKGAPPLPPPVPLGGPLHAPPKGPTPEQNSDHASGYNGIYGGFVGKSITVDAQTHVHYDETLRQAGPVSHYAIVSWFEDNISHDVAGGAEAFWWPPGATQ